MSSRKAVSVLAITFIIVSALHCIPFIFGEIKLATNPYLFDPNQRTLYIFFRFFDQELFRHDIIADYFSALWIPIAFKALQFSWAQFADPIILHRILSPLLWLACVPLVYHSAKRLGGLANAWATVALYLCSSVFLFRMAAGMPHSFGFPFLWWAVTALVSGRVKSLALATALSAAFYPAVTPICGLMLAFWLLFPRLTPAIVPQAPELQWSFKKKIAFLTITAMVTILLSAPMFFHHFSSEFGRSISMYKENVAFPESGPEGRNKVLVAKEPLSYVLLFFLYQNSTRFGATGSVILTLLGMAVLCAGLLLHDVRDRRPSALNPFLYAVALCFFGGLVVYYDSAYRFAVYPVPILVTLFLPLSLRRISRRLGKPGARGTIFAFSMLAYIACIAKVQPEASGYLYSLDNIQKDAVAFAATLPKDTIIAGWPGDDSGKIVEAIPYFSRRQVLVTWEGHAAAHTNYVLTLRERMNAIVDAYLAKDIAPLIALRDRFHVDYFVINEADFASEEPPSYFEPFNQRALERWKENKPHFIVLQLAKRHAVYYHNGIAIIDLHQL